MKRQSYLSVFTTYITFFLLIVFGYVRDYMGILIRCICSPRKNFKKFSLVDRLDGFFIRRIYSRLKSCWNRPITGAPANNFNLLILEEQYGRNYTEFVGEDDRLYNEMEIDNMLVYEESKSEEDEQYTNHTVAINNHLHHIDRPSSKKIGLKEINLDFLKISKNVVYEKNVINLASYNYLGYGTSDCEKLKNAIEILKTEPVVIPSPVSISGNHVIFEKLENKIANFLKKESALIFPMGFGTNITALPALIYENMLVFSDELNHKSLIFGLKLANNCTIKTFSHNDLNDLEDKLRFYIIRGQQETNRSWSKVIVVVEGIYSMEGSMLNIKKLIQLKKKYKFNIYIDEAHSIGAVGHHGCGVSYIHSDYREHIDIFMGTFTKSFGASGGYIATSKKIIKFLRNSCDMQLYGEQMPLPVASHILYSLENIESEQKKLKKNVNFFRKKLISYGFRILGHRRSPIIPLMIYNPGKLIEFSNQCLKSGVAVVVVGYPATSILTSRARLCISSRHTKNELKKALKVFQQVGKKLNII